MTKTLHGSYDETVVMVVQMILKVLAARVVIRWTLSPRMGTMMVRQTITSIGVVVDVLNNDRCCTTLVADDEEEDPNYGTVWYHWVPDLCALSGDSFDSEAANDSGGSSDPDKPAWMKSPSFRKFYRRYNGLRDESDPAPAPNGQTGASVDAPGART